MKKLTLLSFKVMGIQITTFVNLVYENGKAIISNDTINFIFKDVTGFDIPQGETISIG
jgi:hypothetical protein